MNKIFKKFPKAKPFWKVGERLFLHHQEADAKLFAAQNGLKVEKEEKTKTTAKRTSKKTVTDGTTKG